MKSYEEILRHINSIIESYDFIDIGEIIELLDNSDLNYTEKLELMKLVYSNNYKIIKDYERENKLLSEPGNFKVKKKNYNFLFPIDEKKEEGDILPLQKHIKIDTASFVQSLLLMNNFEDIKNYVQSNISQSEYESTLNIIISAILKEKIDLTKLVNEEKIETGNTDNSLDSDISKLSFLLDSLFKIRNQDINSNTSTPKNTLIYLTTGYGNISIENDLKAIPIEFYDSFYSLFLSIQNGNFKNFKRIGTSSGNYKTNMLQVKENYSRVLYDQIEPGIYIITTMFVKKFQVAKDYQSNLKNMDSLLYNQLPYIHKQLKNNREEFLKVNQNITNALFEKLLSKDKGASIDGEVRTKIK